MKLDILAYLAPDWWHYVIAPRGQRRNSPNEVLGGTNMSKQAAREFVERYFAIEEGGTCERKAYTRFKNSTAVEGMDENTKRALFEAATGKTATYDNSGNFDPIKRRSDERDAQAIVNAMDGKPTSLSDLAIKAGVVSHKWSGNEYASRSVRKCIHEMGKAGIIGMVEITTCGKCAIRLYNVL